MSKSKETVIKKQKPKRAKIGFHTLNQNEYDAKALKRALHARLWNMRGKYGYDNVKLVHLVVQQDEHEKGDPKEAFTWNYFVESMSVVAFSQDGKQVKAVEQVFFNSTGSFDGDPYRSNIVRDIDFDGKKVMVTDFMWKYLHEVVKDRLEYFGNHGLKYEFKIKENIEED